MFVRYENNRLSSQPHAVAGVSGLDSMIGISSYERSVHGNERQKTFKKKKKKKRKGKRKKNESGPFDRASVTIEPATALQ
jgi:hypothetical protein